MDLHLIETKKTTPRRGVQPKTSCIHFTAGYRGPGQLRRKIEQWAVDLRKSSTDFVIGRAPKIDRTCRMYRKHARTEAEFGDYTWHSGGSIWRGEKKTNLEMIGIDLDNYGFLQKIDGKWCFRRWGFNSPSAENHKWQAGDKVFPGPVFVDAEGRGWEAYTDEAIAELHRVLTYVRPHLELPGALVGHEDIRSTKSDPGRAFDQYWPEVRKLLEG